MAKYTNPFYEDNLRQQAFLKYLGDLGVVHPWDNPNTTTTSPSASPTFPTIEDYSDEMIEREFIKRGLHLIMTRQEVLTSLKTEELKEELTSRGHRVILSEENPSKSVKTRWEFLEME